MRGCASPTISMPVLNLSTWIPRRRWRSGRSSASITSSPRCRELPESPGSHVIAGIARDRKSKTVNHKGHEGRQRKVFETEDHVIAEIARHRNKRVHRGGVEALRKALERSGSTNWFCILPHALIYFPIRAHRRKSAADVFLLFSTSP